MDQTIRKIIELDAETETKLQASKLACRNRIKDARKQASAIKQAQSHQTRDTISEFEEQTRAEYEEQVAQMQQRFDREADALSEQFEVQHQTLLESLFRETLSAAEQ